MHFNRLKPSVQLPPNLILNQTDDQHVAGPGEELPVGEENGDIDGDIPAEASETDDEIYSNIDREIPPETSESDDEIETEELPVDQVITCKVPKMWHMMKMYKCQKMFQPTSNVRQDTARDLTDGDKIFMIYSPPPPPPPPSYEEGGSVAHAL